MENGWWVGGVNYSVCPNNFLVESGAGGGLASNKRIYSSNIHGKMD